ncbi:unnamed protein product [Zymoseptoria tritici ST99CH_1A5]|uniref:FAD-binding PCMH-type domain-containing protein n=1 Tax=Zymoseptoria tritici ST99CH_1A5 TaxID=1276529 RepID=A0A1Y6LCU8_ZYMTR|nr:unnamed protein product [Zymoseptoria tritici ST99CH_3D1]SMY22312.1 unnamed protein product [Zymoseptoria tritici ST99CH_1A5]
MSAQDRVGGFVLGGGLSWFSNQYGWACDNVLEFEVVTPLGRKLWANMDLNQGLFWALKGSSGALGIVTKITVPTIHNGVIYGGALTFEAVHLPRLLQGIEDLAGSALDDSSNSGHLSLTWHASAKSFSYSSYIVNTASNQSASALMSFRAISHKTSSLRPMTIAESARELADIDSLPGTRRTYFTLTIRLNTKAMHTIHDAALVAARDMGIDANETCRVLFQPITIPHLLASYRKNVFDLNAAHGPLLLISVKMTWVEPERDEHFNHKTTALRRLIEEKMKRMEALEDFIHPLYAASDQDLFAQEEWKTSPNGRMLKAVAREYDPDEVWSKMVPGTWHV